MVLATNVLSPGWGLISVSWIWWSSSVCLVCVYHRMWCVLSLDLHLSLTILQTLLQSKPQRTMFYFLSVSTFYRDVPNVDKGQFQIKSWSSEIQYENNMDEIAIVLCRSLLQLSNAFIKYAILSITYITVREICRVWE